MDAITKSVEILTSPKSDHLADHMYLSFDTAIRGDGYWKFNNKWLDNDNFSGSLLNGWQLAKMKKSIPDMSLS